MTQIEPITSKGQLVVFRFMQDQAAASQSAVALFVAETFQATAPGTLEVVEVAVPFDFDVVGIAVSSHQARTAGTLTVDATINGAVTGLTAVLDATNTQWKTTRQPREKDRGVAGQRIGAKLTTDAGWLPATADIVVDVYVLVFLDGI